MQQQQTETSSPYVLLSKLSLTPRPHRVLESPTPSQVNDLVRGETVLALDLETNGLDPTAVGARVIGIGLSGNRGVTYCRLRTWSPESRVALVHALSGVELVSHNVAFDGAWLLHLGVNTPALGRWYRWAGCSLVLFKLLTTEGWKGQRWKLETAETDVLGWRTSNKEALEELLGRHGLTKATMSELDVLEPNAFASYCAQDAEACRQLWQHLINTCRAAEWGQPLLGWLHRFMIQIRMIVEQQLRGVELNVAGIEKFHSELEARAYELELEFLRHPLIAPHVAEWNNKVIETMASRQPVKHDRWEQHLLKEPPNRTNSGEPSKRWEAWYLKKLAVDAEPQYNPAWTAWKARLDRAKATQHFNTNSGDQLKWLFFERLGYESMKRTESGEDSIDSKVLRQLGDAGRLLLRYRKVVKEDGYVRACLEFTRPEPGTPPGVGVFRPTIRPHGTITGRIAGGFG